MGGENKNLIVMEKGQLIEISVKVNSESFPWNTYSCGCGGCGSGSGTTSRGSGGFSSCSSCSGATPIGPVGDYMKPLHREYLGVSEWLLKKFLGAYLYYDENDKASFLTDI